MQQLLIGVVGAAGIAFAFVPRRKSPLQLAALTGALLAGFELVLTHWSYLYIPWFFPFVVVAVLAPALRPREPAEPELEPLVRLPERRLVTAGLGALGVLLVSWLLLHTSFWSRLPITDVPVYERYGAAMVAGEVPYRDFALEYPPAALAAFVIPAYGEGADGFRQVFEVEMWLCGAAALLAMLVVLNALGRSLWATRAALAFAAVMPLLLGSVVLSRFDLLPAALAVAGLAGLVTGRHRLGLAALALGAAAKVYPAVLIPPALVYVARRAGAREAWLSAAAAAGTVVAIVLPFLVVAPRGLWDSLTIHATRGLQVESLGAGVLYAAHHLGGLGLAVTSGSGSQNLSGGEADVLAAALTLTQALGVVALWAAFWRGPADQERLVRYFAATVCVFVALGKVLSPQFLIWLIPLVPLVAGRRGVVASGLLGAAAVMTQIWFPFRYWDLVQDFDATASWLVLLRGVTLLAIVAVLVAPARLFARSRAPTREAALEPAPGRV